MEDNYLVIKKATRNISTDGNEWINPDDIKAINDAAFNMAEEIEKLKKLNDTLTDTIAQKPYGIHFCSFCGNKAYIYRIEDKEANCYCDYCFKKLVISL